MFTVGRSKRFTILHKNTDSSEMVSVQGAVHHKWPFHRYWQDPVVLNKLSKAMGPSFGGEAVEGEEGEEEEEEEEEDDEAVETVFDAATSGDFLAPLSLCIYG